MVYMIPTNFAYLSAYSTKDFNIFDSCSYLFKIKW